MHQCLAARLTLGRLRCAPTILPKHDRTGRRSGLAVIPGGKLPGNAMKRRVTDEPLQGPVVQLAAGVAHDLRNLLTAIELYTDLLTNELPRETASRGYADEIAAAARRAGEAVAQLLSSACGRKAEAGHAVPATVLAGMRDMLQQLLGPNAELKVESCGPIWAVTASSAELQQLILNLARNARDAMAEGGQLTIAISAEHVDADRSGDWAGDGLTRQGAYVKIEMSDTGKGMDKATLGRVFEPFFTTRPGKGTGLGLPAVHSMVTRHGGAISIVSQPGRGTTVTVLLPRASSKIRKSAAPRRRKAKVRGGSETILVVENHAALRAAVAQLLSECGYKVLTAADDRAAVRITKRHREKIHLVLADQSPAEDGGGNLAREIRRLHPHVRVLLISSSSRPGAKNGSGHNMLAKPFNQRALAERVRSVLDGAAPVVRAR